MHSRRRFLTLAAGTALGVAVAGAPRGWADPAPTLAAGLAGRAPTAWGTTMPGIVSSFKPDGKQIALTFDLCPGGYDDALVKTLVANKIPAVLFLNSRWIDKHFGHPAHLPRAGLPEEIGPVVAFLASRRNSYMTGANINVDGGSDFT